MNLKFLQLNIYQGKFLNEIINYVIKEGFDILNFQEVNGGLLSFNQGDCFKTLKEELKYNGELFVSWNIKKDKESYFGNATLFKDSFKFLDKQTVYLKDYREIDILKKRRVEDDPRSFLSLILEKNNKRVQVINTHLAWGKTASDEPHKIEQGEKLYKYVKNINYPFILSGDFNVTPQSKIVKMLNTLGRNLTAENKITNTLNPKTTKFPHLFPPGLAIDFVYVSKDIKVNKFKVIDNIALSDHYGLYVEIEI